MEEPMETDGNEVHATRNAVATGRAQLGPGLPSKVAELFEHPDDCDYSDNEITDNVISYDADEPHARAFQDAADAADPDFLPSMSADDTEEPEENLLDGLSTDDGEDDHQDHAESSRMAEAREQLRQDAELAAALEREQRLLLENGDLRNQVASLQTAAGTRVVRESEPCTGKSVDMSKLLARPDKFTGSDTDAKKFQEWVLYVNQYVDLMGVHSDRKVKIAAAYLAGDALTWWSRQREHMLEAGQDVLDMEVFVQALRERFFFRNPELQARNDLRSLKQGSLLLPQYISKFEDCYSYLPTFDEADKIDRFIAGLNDKWQEKAMINPLTGHRWVEYQPMVNYLVSMLGAAITPTGLLREQQGQQGQQGQGTRQNDNGHGQRQPPGPAWQRTGRQNRLERRARNRQQRGAARNGQPRLPNNSERRKVLTNASGQRFWRTAAQMTYMITQHKDMCACCLKNVGHRYSECTASPERTAPPGYNEWRQQQQLQRQ
jgi:hypothetical protein